MHLKFQLFDKFSFHCVLLFAVLALVVSVNTVAAEVDSQRIGNGNPNLGRVKSDDNRCQECHGVQGMSDDERFPNHAGQLAGYLVKQLTDFQTGKRIHPTMNLMTEDLDASDKADIAAYFASQNLMQGLEAIENNQAKALFLHGDAKREVPACVSCHGENGKGKSAEGLVYPVIAGQRRVYLHTQLVAWQMGERTNSPGNVMNKIAKALSNDEIAALANYLSGL